jgi:hypothetical protein
MNEWQCLARQVRQGNAAAEAELRGKLEIQMTRIVRRTLRRGTADSALARRILAEADRVAAAEHRPAIAPPGLVGRVARRICDALTDKLSAGPAAAGPRDTIRMA